MATCYMCDNEATTVEHVPPQCLFPEQKDLPAGTDLRKNLLTVPSCEDHNLSKSGNDEYLLYLLVMNLPSNDIAKNQFLTKIDRAIKRNPSLINRYINDPQAVVAQDSKTGESFETAAIKIEFDRFKTSVDSISRSLYFLHFKEKWTGSIQIQPDFMLVSLDPKDAEKNQLITNMAKATDVLFKDAEFHGANPEVFKYQVVEGNNQVAKVMRLHFYEGGKVTIFFMV